MAKKQPVRKPDTKQTEVAATKDETLETVLKAFNTSWQYTSSSWHDRWQNNYKLYNNERVKRGYLGISDTFVPMTFSTVETLTSALFGTKPKFGYLPPAEKANQNTEILNGLLDHYWEIDQWSMKVINTGRGMVREGTAVDYLCWDVDCLRLINVPIRDFFISPEAFEIDERSTRYAGRRFLTTWDELDSYEVLDVEAMEAANSEEPIYKKKYKNLDKLKNKSTETDKTGSGANQEQTTDKQEKDMFYGSTLTEHDDDEIEVIEYWTVDKTISVANRRVVIEDGENIYKAKARANGVEFPKGLLPFAPCRNYIDSSLFYAKSDVDFIADQQEDLNDFSNQNKDAVSFNLNQMKTLDPKYAHLLKEIENLPGAVYPIEAGMLVPVQNGQIPAEAFNERMNIKAEIRETTASNEVVKGASQQGGTGNTTATEINAQIAGSGNRLNLKVTQVENEYFHRLAKISLKLLQLYVTEPMMVRILGKDGAKWEEFDPIEFKGEYEPRIQLDISIQAKKQQQAAQTKELLAAFLNDPNINQQELSKLVLQRSFDLDPDEVEALMAVQPPPMAGMPGDPMAAMMGAGDPNAMPAEPMDMMGGAPSGPAPAMPPEQPMEQQAPVEGDPMQEIADMGDPDGEGPIDMEALKLLLQVTSES